MTESQIIAAVGTFGLLLLLYLWDGLVGFLPSTAVGSLLGFFVVLILVCFLINALSNNWKVTAGVLVAGAAVLIAFYLRDSSVFAQKEGRNPTCCRMCWASSPCSPPSTAFPRTTSSTCPGSCCTCPSARCWSF